jgi:hypothetical protein
VLSGYHPRSRSQQKSSQFSSRARRPLPAPVRACCRQKPGKKPILSWFTCPPHKWRLKTRCAHMHPMPVQCPSADAFLSTELTEQIATELNRYQESCPQALVITAAVASPPCASVSPAGRAETGWRCYPRIHSSSRVLQFLWTSLWLTQERNQLLLRKSLKP